MQPSEIAPDNLADLRPNYLMRLRKRVDALKAFLAVVERDGADGGAFEDSHRCVHSMISSASIFGYPALSVAARAAEEAFDTQERNGTSPIKERVADVVRMADDVLRSDGRAN